MKTSFFFSIYIAISLIYLLTLIPGNEQVAACIKPLLLIPLFSAVVVHTDFSSKKIVLSALAFSWIGDVVLLFSGRSPLFFIGGLLSFLIAHIFYIVLFTREKRSHDPSVLRTSHKSAIVITGFIAIIIYLFLFLSFLIPHLGDLKIPVCIYAVVISVMLCMALFGYPKWSSPGRIRILSGAVFFVISDSLLAINKFYQPFWQASFFIMLTYLLAQYGIVSGLILLHKKVNIRG